MSQSVSFPFRVTALPIPAAVTATATGSETIARRFCIQPDPGPAAETYRDLFQAFGFSGNGKSWSEHIQAIVEEEEPELFDHLEFTTEAGFCRVYVESAAIADRFTTLLCPLFADLHKLRRHFSLLDSEDFFE